MLVFLGEGGVVGGRRTEKRLDVGRGGVGVYCICLEVVGCVFILGGVLV